MTDVHLILTWNGEFEQAFLEEGPAGDGEGVAGVYEADVPIELWAAYTVGPEGHRRRPPATPRSHRLR